MLMMNIDAITYFAITLALVEYQFTELTPIDTGMV
jgi:hypothetical protein